MQHTSAINTAWHKAHPMPKNPTIDQRIAWHLEHLKHCSCRTDIPAGLQKEMKKRNISNPSKAIPKPSN